MTLTFKALSKNGKTAFYTGAANVLRFPVNAFLNKKAPSSIEVEGDFAEAVAAKPVLTPEEKAAKVAAAKAARAAKPKPTLAEKIAAREAALAKLKAQAAADATM